jgi:hypothetical protein
MPEWVGGLLGAFLGWFLASRRFLALRLIPARFGDNTTLRIDSESAPGSLAAFPSLSRTVLEVNDARVFAGIHFRTSCLDGNNVRRSVARFVMDHSMRPELEESGHD